MRGDRYMLMEVIKDTALDSIKLLPFLYITYLLIELIEHKVGEAGRARIGAAKKSGPIWGALFGIIPQCGFSAAASSLYAGRIITLGTLISIFLSTSDEMLPVFISNQVAIGTILKILSIKVLIGMAAGFVIDLVLQKKHKETGETEHLKIDEMCDHQHCHCGQGNIWKAAISHTLQILFFIVVVSFILNLLISYIGEDSLSTLLSSRPMLGPVIAGLVGLIPNCAASVVLTQLYLEGMINGGAMMAGLLAGAGVQYFHRPGAGY